MTVRRIKLVVELDADRVTQKEAENLMLRSIAMDVFDLPMQVTFSDSFKGCYLEVEDD